MLEHEGDAGEIARQGGGIAHLTREHLQIEAQPALLDVAEAGAPGRIGHQVRARREAIERILVPVQLLAHAAQIGVRQLTVERIRDVGRSEVGVADDGVGKAMAVGD